MVGGWTKEATSVMSSSANSPNQPLRRRDLVGVIVGGWTKEATSAKVQLNVSRSFV
jgi:hypothetical protein